MAGIELRIFRATLFALIATLLSVAARAAEPPTPKFEAKLYADHAAIWPGGQVELAVEIKLGAGWHLYHPIQLDTGLPTQIDFELPRGATAGDLHFPMPILRADRAGKLVTEYLSLEGRFVVLATLKLSADADRAPLSLKATVRGLACKELCVPVEAEAALTLNMSDGPAVPANEKLFQDARALLPKPLAQADYIEGSRLVVSHTKVPAGGKGTLAAVIRVKPGQHVQDRNPGVAELIPSRLFIESRPGLSFDAQAQIWPKPQVRAIPGIGSVREHSGEFIIQAPFEIDDKKFEPGPLRLRVLFSYQSCSDAGVCYPPTMAEGFFDFEAVPAGVPAVKNEEFAQLALPTTVEPAGSSSPPQGGPSVAPPAALDQPGLWLIFLGAFIGGAILNITPCVLPVISLKVFGFMRQAGQDRGRVLRMGLVYAAGILASFAVLAVLIMGASFAWGGLMQSPAFLIGLCAFVFAFALSLLGVFEIQLPGAAVSAADAAASKEGYAGAFLNGVFATFLATPCVGPFLGSAVGLLAKTPALVGGAGILIAGLGLAAPYVLLTAFPGWLRWLPRPGAWMVTFKQVLGFILAVVVVWLLSVLIAMVGRGQFLGTLGLLCAVGVGAWLLGKVTLSDSAGRASAKWLTALAAVVAGGCFSFWAFADKPSAIPWQTWEPGLAERLASEGYTVYVDYTASWCLTCQANKRLVLQSDQVAGELKRLGAYPIEADFTSQNREMFKELRQHDRAGVPLNIIVPAGKPGEPIILPEVLTRSIVLEALQRAGPSSKIPEFWTRDP